MKLDHFKDKIFYKTLISIALPITIQNLISTSLNMVDTVMIGRLGEKQIAAVGLANQIFFLFILIAFGINSGASIFIAQFWGKKDILNIRKVLGLTILSGGIVSLIFTLGAFFIPEFLLSIFSKDQRVILLGSQYLRIVCFSYLMTSVSFAYGFASRSVGQAKLPMYVSAISLLCNTIMNYLLIFGHFGFPVMGVRGAALATLISRLLEMVLMLGIIYRKGDTLAGKIHEMLGFSRRFVTKFFDTALPVIINESFWSLGMVMYSVAYARIGTGAIAAVQISNTVQNVFMVINMGLANASAVMLGNQLGANRIEKAVSYAYIFSILGPTVGMILGVMLYLTSPLVLSVFNVSNSVFLDSSRIMMVMAVVMFAKMFNAILIVGILRSGGDTKFALVLELGSVWIIGVPLAFLGAFLWKLPVYWVVALVSLEEVVKALMGIPRVLSKKWAKNVVDYL